MDKDTWIMHLVNSEAITRPSLGGSLETWKAAQAKHRAAGCVDCAARLQTIKRGQSQRLRNQAMRDLGLTRVVGAISGKVYWE